MNKPQIPKYQCVIIIKGAHLCIKDIIDEQGLDSFEKSLKIQELLIQEINKHKEF